MNYKYDGIIFDFDGVILNSGRDNYQWAHKIRKEEAKKIGLRNITGNELNLLFSCSNIEEFNRKLETFGLSFSEYKEIEKKVAKQRLNLAKENFIKPFPDARTTLEMLELPSSVASNAYHQSTSEIIQYFEFDTYFNTWNAPQLEDLVEYLRVMKPNPLMLQENAKEMNAENPIMVGDSKSDIKAAKNAGFDSVLLDRNQREFSYGETYRISNLEELKQIIQE